MYNKYYLPICGIMSEVEIVTHSLSLKGKLGSFIISLIIFIAFLTVIIEEIHSGTYTIYSLAPLIVIILFFVALLVVIAATVHKSMRGQRLAEMIKSHIVSASEDLIVFDKSMKIMLGYLVLRGVWKSSGKHRYYSISSRFYEVGNVFSNRIVLDRRFLDNYTIAVTSNGEGYVKLPALLIKNEDMGKDRIVLITVPSRTIYEEGDVDLKISTPYGDSAYASLRINGNVLEGTLLYLSKGKSRSVKIVLNGVIRHEVFGKVSIRKEIFRARNTGTYRLNTKLAPPKPLLIISSMKLFTPLYLVRILRNITGTSRGETYLYGFSDGEYNLRLQLDIPLRPDKYVDERIVFKPVTEK